MCYHLVNIQIHLANISLSVSCSGQNFQVFNLYLWNVEMIFSVYFQGKPQNFGMGPDMLEDFLTSI